MAKKKNLPWIPESTGPMRFIKILNLEFYDPEVSPKVFDVNVLEELTTGEIFLYYYFKGSKVPISFSLLDKNVGITDLHHQVRSSLRANSGKKLKVFKIEQTGVIDVQFPNTFQGEDDRISKENEKERSIPVKDRVNYSNDTADALNDTSKPTRKRRVKVEKEPEVKDKTETVKRKTRKKPAIKEDIKETKKVAIKSSKPRKKTPATKSDPELKTKAEVQKKNTTRKKKTTSNKSTKSKSLF